MDRQTDAQMPIADHTVQQYDNHQPSGSAQSVGQHT